MDSLFGGKLPEAANFVIAFVVVLLLIALLAWIVRRFTGASRGGARGRQPRLGVVDAATVDTRRRLILVRRDNVEHLLMIGGPTDLVIEPNIGRTAAASAAEPTAVRAAPMSDAPSRSTLSDDATAAPQPPLPAPVQRDIVAPPAEAAAAPPVEPKVRASRSQALADLADILAPHAPAASARPQPDMVETPQQPAPPSAVPPVESPVLTTPADAAQAVPEVHPEPPLAPRPDQSRNSYENLRPEMASLLGRPQGKT
jgi:flagellar biogenesis protein FliO